MTSVVDLARLIDPEAWAHAEEYAAMMNVVAPNQQPFFEQQVKRLTATSMQAALRVAQHLQPAEPEPETPNRKTRRSTK